MNTIDSNIWRVQLVTLAEAVQTLLLDIASWWRIHRIIKAFYVVFAMLLIYLRATGEPIGLTVLEEIMPWWSVVLIFGLPAVYLEDGQPVGWYFVSLVPMFVYALALFIGVMTGTLSPIGLLPVAYLIFGCLGFMSGIYGAWRVRQLIYTVRQLRRALERSEINDPEEGYGRTGT